MAIDFLGTDESIICGSSASLDDITNMTIAAWINPDTFNAGQAIVSKLSNDSSSGWFFFTVTEAGQPKALALYTIAFPTAGNWRSSSNAISTGVWQHVAMAYTEGATAATPTFYINGVVSGTTTISQTAAAPVSDAAASMAIGIRDIATDDYWFDGRMEDVRVFNRTLSANEVATLANGFRGPLGGEVLWLPMDDFSEPFYSSGALSSVAGAAKSRIYDRSGNGNHGTPNGGATIQPVVNAPWTNPNGSTALDFSINLDGSDDHIQATSAAFGFSTGPFSVCGWVYPTSTVYGASSQATLIGRGYGNFEINIYEGNLSAYVGGTSHAPGAKAISSGAWHHFALSRNSTDVSLYVDGASGTATANADNTSTTALPLVIGTRSGTSGAGDNYFIGAVEDIRIFNRALSAAEIGVLAGGSVAKLGGEVLWLSASRRQGKGQFDGVPLNADNVVPDYSGNGNVGTPSGQPTGQASYAPREGGWIP